MGRVRYRLKALIKDDGSVRERATAVIEYPRGDLLEALPAELRVLIYEYVLTFDGPILQRLRNCRYFHDHTGMGLGSTRRLTPA